MRGGGKILSVIHRCAVKLAKAPDNGNIGIKVQNAVERFGEIFGGENAVIHLTGVAVGRRSIGKPRFIHTYRKHFAAPAEHPARKRQVAIPDAASVHEVDVKVRFGVRAEERIQHSVEAVDIVAVERDKNIDLSVIHHTGSFVLCLRCFFFTAAQAMRDAIQNTALMQSAAINCGERTLPALIPSIGLLMIEGSIPMMQAAR